MEWLARWMGWLPSSQALKVVRSIWCWSSSKAIAQSMSGGSKGGSVLVRPGGLGGLPVASPPPGAAVPPPALPLLPLLLAAILQLLYWLTWCPGDEEKG